MSAECVWSGAPASPGIAVGAVWHLEEQVEPEVAAVRHDAKEETALALTALASAVAELEKVARGLPAAEAAIVETSALMGGDPALIQAIEEVIVTDGAGAAEAILRATGDHAAAIAALDDEMLAARADDVRSLGRRASRLVNGTGRPAPPGSELILIAHDLGPADVAELGPVLAGIALTGGAATAHAAIVARSLGVPMVAGLGEALQELEDGAQVVIDGSSGIAVSEPSDEREQHARRQMAARRETAQRAHNLRDEPAVTVDGTRVPVLANVASREELEVGLSGGAEGVGLLRTELAFLEAAAWPSEDAHLQALTPILDGLEGRTAIVRVLDFGADKSPPFLRDVTERGIALLLANPDHFSAQLRALLSLSQAHDLRLLLPMVEVPAQLSETRALFERAARELGIGELPPLGSMIETPAAARNASEIAALSDFLSIGTNDLTASTLGADRFAMNSARTHDPRVLTAIAQSVAAAHDAGIEIEVCGEAASDPITMPLLVGLGVDELSVGAARVGVVRDWIRQLGIAQTGDVAHSALVMETAEEVELAVRPLLVERALVH